MMGKGRKKQERLGGGIAFLHRKEGNFKVEEIDAGDSDMSEDVLPVRVERLDDHEKVIKSFLVVVYLTVESERAARENRLKLNVVKKTLKRECWRECDGHG